VPGRILTLTINTKEQFMLVIGLGTGGKLLVEMTEHELQYLSGTPALRNGQYQSPGGFWYSVIGMKFDVVKAWVKMRDLQQNREALNKAVRQLRAVADVCEPLEPLVTFPEEPKEEANEESESSDN